MKDLIIKQIQERTSKIKKEVLLLMEENSDCRVFIFADSNKFDKNKLIRTGQIVLYDKIKYYEFYDEKYIVNRRYVNGFEQDYFHLNSEAIKINVDKINEFLSTLKYDNIELELKILENKTNKFPKTTHKEYIQLSIKFKE